MGVWKRLQQRRNIGGPTETYSASIATKPASCALANSSTKRRSEGPQIRARPRRSTVDQKQPRTLEVTEEKNSVEQHLVFPSHCLQLSGDEIGMTDRRSQNFDALLNSWDHGTCPHHGFWVGDAGNLLKCVAPDRTGPGNPACTWSSSCTTAHIGPTRASGVAMQTSSWNAIRNSPGFIRLWMASKAPCCPTANNKGIMASPCSPPSP